MNSLTPKVIGIAALALCCSLACAGTAPAEQDADLEPMGPDRLSDIIWQIERNIHLGDHPQYVRGYADSVWAESRVAAAFVLGRLDDLESEKVLRGLLKDPDVVVRRVAAESLLGDEWADAENAERYGYAEVLPAERKAREIGERIRRGDQMEQYRATRELMALGWPAAWQVHLLGTSPDEAVAWSAAYAWRAMSVHCLPRWAVEVNAKLDRKVTFRVRSVSVDNALAKLSAVTGIEIRCQEGPWEKVSVSADGVPAREVLDDMAMQAECDWRVSEGGISVYGPRHSTGAIIVLIDVRDIESTGFRPDWAGFLERELLPDPDDRWISIPELGGILKSHGGILKVWVPYSGVGRQATAWAQEKRLKPILTYLNKLREERGLPRGAE
jgi:hypothetical protein